MRMTGNTIFITGSTCGIGRALAEAFHGLGNQVIVAGRRRDQLAAMAAANPGIDTVELDVTDVQSIRRAADSVIAKHPSLNVVINNAGILPFEHAGGEPDDEQAVRLIETNLLGPVRISSAFLGHLKRQPQSWLINSSSVLTFAPLASTALYAAIKAAIHSYTLSQRSELRGTSVGVLEIDPPWTDIDLIHKNSDPRAIPLEQFIQASMERLAAARHEALIDSAAVHRDVPGRDEDHAERRVSLEMARTPVRSA